MAKFQSFGPVQVGLASVAAHGSLLLLLTLVPILNPGERRPAIPPPIAMQVSPVVLEDLQVSLEVTAIPPVETEAQLVEAELPTESWRQQAPVQDWLPEQNFYRVPALVARLAGKQARAQTILKRGNSHFSRSISEPSTAEKKAKPRVTYYRVPSTSSVAAGQVGQKAVPMTAHCPAPPYPSLALQRGWQGVSKIWASISAQGRVLQVRVETSSGYPVLDRAALRAVRGWKFKAALIDGKPVAATIVLPLRFQIPKWE
jgi:TonB family protein